MYVYYIYMHIFILSHIQPLYSEKNILKASGLINSDFFFFLLKQITIAHGRR